MSVTQEATIQESAVQQQAINVYVVRIDQDSELECPCQEGDWQFECFHPNYRGSVPERTFTLEREDTIVPTRSTRNKLRVGLAWLIDLYEHSGRVFSVSGDGQQCLWDTSSNVGILVWTGKPSDIGAKTIDDRRKDAVNFMERYTDLAEGRGLGYSIEYHLCDEPEDLEQLSEMETYSRNWENTAEIGYAVDTVNVCPSFTPQGTSMHVDSCYGFFASDADYMCETIRDSIASHMAETGIQNEPYRIVVTGSMHGICDDGDKCFAPIKEKP